MITKTELEFLKESNAIEQEYSKVAFDDAKKAWVYIKNLKKMTVKDILEVHRLLAQHIRPDIAGKFRDCDVWIGGEVKKFYSKELFIHMLTHFYVSMKKKLPEEDNTAFAKRMHIIFEGIHPFEDFNGRVGRLVMNWHRVQIGLPIKVIRADWPQKGGDQDEYYKWFR